MGVYSTQLFVGEVSSTGTTFFTAPANTTTVVRDVEAFSGASTSSFISVDLFVSGSFTAVLAGWSSVAANTWLGWRGRAVMNAGQTLTMNFASGPVWLWVSGYELV